MGKADVNPYEYNVDKFLAVRPELIRYAETSRIETPFEALRGVGVTSDGRILVAGDNAVAAFDGEGKEVSRIQLGKAVQCVAAGGDGTVFVGMRDHVEVYGARGAHEGTWTGLGERAFVRSVAVSGEDVFVGDFGSKMVWRFDGSGTLRGQIGTADKSRGYLGFILPSPYFDVAVGPDGSLWAVNTGRRRVERYSFEGELLGSWGKESMGIEGFCGCCNPTHIAIRGDGSFVTSEKGLPRVKIYNSEGEFECVVAAPKDFAEGTVGLDVAVDAGGRVLVADPKAKAVRIFTEREASAEEQAK